MMRALTLVPALTLVLLVGGQVTLIPGQADAWCCGCMCMSWCTCDGQVDSSGTICWYCNSTDLVLQTNTSTDKVTKLLKGASDYVLSAIAQSDITQIELTTGQKCFREKVALSLLGKNRVAMKLAPIRFDEKKVEGLRLAFQDNTD